MRVPLQGGLQPGDRPAGPVVEIVCDESGFSGTNLLDPAHPMLTQASVDLSVGEADRLINELWSGFRLAPYEVKSAQLFRRPDADAVLDRFLTALTGRAHVHLIDKEFFLVTRIVDLFLTEPSYLAGTSLTESRRPPARALYRTGRPAGPSWTALLTAFTDLVRTRRQTRPDPRRLDRFFQARDALLRDRTGVAVLAELDRTRVRAVLTRLFDDDPALPPPLEPLLPALIETVLFWSGGGRQVQAVHDEQSALTAGRLRRLQQALADGTGRPSPLAGLVVADSRDDPRVQVADLLAGVARRRRWLPRLSLTTLRAGP